MVNLKSWQDFPSWSALATRVMILSFDHTIFLVLIAPSRSQEQSIIAMLTESFVTSTFSSGKPSLSASSAVKDVGICLHELQPHLTPRHNFKKSSTKVNCLAISESHVFAAQADKAVIHVYSREKGNQDATVPFPERIHSLAYVGTGSALLVIGTEGGRLNIWELASGRLVSSSASHLQAVSSLVICKDHHTVLSGSSDSSVHVWSLHNLISFSQTSEFSSNATPQKAPLRTFSNHRSGITALACGHSSTSTNFAVSASTDSTCYVWSIKTCELLMTFLLPSSPLCFTVDPADRAVYAGYEDGTIQMIDFYRALPNMTDSRIESIYNVPYPGPVQLETNSTWSSGQSDIGSAQCVTLSYDGTVLLSGHASGKIILWDVAKCNLKKEIINLGQSVTNITMLRPDGLPNDRPQFEVRTVTKPKLDVSTNTTASYSGVPSSHALNGQMTSSHSQYSLPTPPAEDHAAADFQRAFTGATFPQHLIDDALRELATGIKSAANGRASSDSNVAKIAQLEAQVAGLQSTLKRYKDDAADSRAEDAAETEDTVQLDEQGRQAPQDATSEAGDGDVAMQED